MKNKKKGIVIAIVVILILAAAAAGIIYAVRNRSGETVDVYSMELLNNAGWMDSGSALNGTITSDYVQEVYPDAEEDVETVYVQQGDTVKKGDNLLKYDVEQQELDLQLQELEIKSSQMELEDMEKELERMKSARSSASADTGDAAVMHASLDLSSLRGSLLDALTGPGTVSAAATDPDAPGQGEDDTEDEKSPLLSSAGDLSDAESGSGTKEDPYVFVLRPGATIRRTLLSTLIGDEKKDVYAYFFVYDSEEKYNDDAGKEASGREHYTDRIIISPDKYAAAWTEESYDFADVQSAVRDRKLRDSITDVSDRASGEGTDGAPYVYLLRGEESDPVISGSVICDLLRGGYTAVFKMYESETACAANASATTASFVLNPVYDPDGIDAGTMYSINSLKEAIRDKNLRSVIRTQGDHTFGDGSANNAYVYLLSENGTVQGSVIHALVKGEYYAQFQEFKDEDAYSSNPHNPLRTVQITPGTAVTGIDPNRAYTLTTLQAALKAAEQASQIPNVLKSEITDKKKDPHSGSGTLEDPYVYRLISGGRIKGSVINDLMKSNEFAVFYEYDSEENGRKEIVANSVEVRPTTVFKESISSFGWYTLTDLNDAMVIADKIEIRPDRRTVTAGKTYNFTAKMTGKNSEVLTVTWELKRNKSTSTTLINGTLTVGEDETADTLRIIASAGGKRGVLTVKVKKSGNSSETDGDSVSGGDTDSGSGDSYDGGGGGSTDYSTYTDDELADAIANQEEEIADTKQNLNEAKIDYQEAKEEVENATVKAKIDGEVTLAYTKEAMPDDGTPAIIVRADEGMYVNVDVSEMSLDTVKVGGTIYCSSWETGEQYEAEIVEISPYPSSGSADAYSYDGLSNPNSSYYPVVAYIKQADGLVTGETVEVSYNPQSMGTTPEDAIFLQKAYVRTDDSGRSYVYKEGKDHRLEKQYVETGTVLYGQYVEILSGVTMDDCLAFPYGKDVKEGAKTERSENTENIIY